MCSSDLETDEREALQEMTTLTCACIERMAIKIHELSSHIHRVAADRGLQEPLTFAEAAAAYEWVLSDYAALHEKPFLSNFFHTQACSDFLSRERFTLMDKPLFVDVGPGGAPGLQNDAFPY